MWFKSKKLWKIAISKEEKKLEPLVFEVGRLDISTLFGPRKSSIAKMFDPLMLDIFAMSNPPMLDISAIFGPSISDKI